MKILRFNDDRIGVIKGEDRVVDVSDAVSSRKAKGPQRVMEEIIEGWRKYRRRFEKLLQERDGVPLAEVRLLCPLPRPSKCLAAFVNYLDRPDRTPESLPNEYFYKSPDLVGPDGAIELVDIPPAVVFQPEAELAFVVGRTAKNVPESQALDHVFGYVPFFDISTRGLVRRTQFIPKGQDTHAACGPWIITKDEIPDPHDVIVRSWTNGEPRQNYSTRHMAHKIPDQIAWLTRFLRLNPGDVVATGTYHEGLMPMNVGDTIEIEFQNLGRARFRVTGNSPRKDVAWLPGKSQPQPPPGGGMHRV
ncbi:MAG TPA: fumarylacetoacetate hydrolase family protein [candidate division Zixibacteria bacterium]|nr:fumarylacetoacetate hydrolase family protein [candidate division Zixibacteria bacterium]